MRAKSSQGTSSRRSGPGSGRRRSLLLGHFGYWAAALVIAFTGWTLYQASGDMRESDARASRSRDSLEILARSGEALGQAQAAQRGYLLTGNERFLAERDEALSRLHQALAQARAWTRSDAQRERIDGLEAAIAERVAVMREAVILRAAKGAGFVAPPAMVRRAEEARASITAISARLRGEELGALEAHRRAQDAQYDRVRSTLLVALVLSLTLLLPGYIAFTLESRARRAAEGLLLDLADSLPGAIFRFRTHRDGTRRFEFLSHGVEALRGVNRETAMRDFAVVWETIVEEDRPRIAGLMAQSEVDLKPVQYDFRVKQPAGGLRWLRAWATLRRDPDQTLVWNGYWADVTDEKALQNDLRDARDSADSASRAKSTFLATMSHEIRTPMNGVLGMVELLSLTPLNGEQRTTLGIIRESGRSLLRIIDDILDFSKVEAGKLELRAEPACIPAIVARVCDVYSGNASSKGLLLKRFIDPALSASVLVDPLRLQQILNNLVSNAIKFTEVGEVEMRAELVERREGMETVRLTVADTGIGVALEESATLFEPFAQAGMQGGAGTGLGLSICRRLAEMMGGRIAMQSEPGCGTTMTLTLTAAVVDPRSVAEAQAQPIGGTGEPDPQRAALPAGTRGAGRLLVVDDHPINRMVLMKQVTALGYEADVAEHGLEALEKWNAGRYALILTDCNMPEMNGYQLAAHIRACERRNGLARIPIIACTANALGGESDNCIAAGMDDYLAKPIGLDHLAAKLEQWLVHAVPAASTPEILDRATLAAISGGDAQIEMDLLAQLHHHNREDREAIAQALALRSFEAAVQGLHRMKGVCRTMGAAPLAAACERVERAARARHWDGVTSEMNGFEREFARLEAHLAGERL